jgi:tripartite-type tricarboxylate transporter receptor subunit TctC
VAARQELPFAFSMMLPAFRGVAAVHGIAGLTNPRGFILADKHQRNPAFPNIPSIVEEGLPAAQSDGWFGLLGPAGVPRRITLQLAADVKNIISQPRIRESFGKMGADAAVDSGPDVYEKLMKSEYDRYVKLVKDIGLKPQ